MNNISITPLFPVCCLVLSFLNFSPSAAYVEEEQETVALPTGQAPQAVPARLVPQGQVLPQTQPFLGKGKYPMGEASPPEYGAPRPVESSGAAKGRAQQASPANRSQLNPSPVKASQANRPQAIPAQARPAAQPLVADTTNPTPYTSKIRRAPNDTPKPALKSKEQAVRSQRGGQANPAPQAQTSPPKKSINTNPAVPEAAAPQARLGPQESIPSHPSASGFYQPRKVRNTLEQRYPGQVTSSTIPEATAKNVRLAGQRHPETGIVFDDRGFPIFDPVVKFDTRISKDIALSGNERKHMRTATKMLREEIQAQRVDPAKFSAEQLQDIMAGRDTIANYTWHHHQDVGRMQLIPRDIHNKTGHIGGNHIWSSQGGN